MTSALLVELLKTLDAPQARYGELDRYYTGTQPLAFLSPEARTALGTRLGRMVSNLPRLVVTSLAERCRITGFVGADIWPDWQRNDLDQLSAVVMREALLYGSAFVIVWADALGRAQVSCESAKQVTGEEKVRIDLAEYHGKANEYGLWRKVESTFSHFGPDGPHIYKPRLAAARLERAAFGTSGWRVIAPDENGEWVVGATDWPPLPPGPR